MHTHTTLGAVLLCPLLLGLNETTFCNVWLNSTTRKTDLAGAELGPRERSCGKMLPKGTNKPTEDEISFSFFCYSLMFSPYVLGWCKRSTVFQVQNFSIIFWPKKKINNQIVVIKNWCLQGNLVICQIQHRGIQPLCKSALVGFVGWGLGVPCFSLRFWSTNHRGAGFSSCCHVNPEISSSLSVRGPSFAEQPGEQSQNFPHTWTELWVCNKADSWPSFSWLCCWAFCTDLLFTALFFFFQNWTIREKRFVEGEERM